MGCLVVYMADFEDGSDGDSQGLTATVELAPPLPPSTSLGNSVGSTPWTQLVSAWEVDDAEELWGEEVEQSFECAELEDGDELGEDGFVKVEWLLDWDSIRTILSKVGLVGQRLALQSGDEEDLLKQIIGELAIEPCGKECSWLLIQLKEEIALCVSREPLAKRARGEYATLGLQTIEDAMRAFTLQVKAKPGDATICDWSGIEEVPRKGSRNRKERTLAGPRESLEKLEREKWCRVLVKLLKKADAPVVLLAQQSSRPMLLLEGMIGTTRSSTMKGYVRHIQDFMDWFGLRGGGSWPSSPVALAEYLHDRKSEPCAPTIPGMVGQSISWFEKAGGWTEGEMISRHPLVLKTIGFCKESLCTGISPLKQAPRIPLLLVGSMELYVMDTTRPIPLRFKSFVTLLKLWGTMREDDVQHVVPKRLRASGEQILTELLRTKTSGGSKRVRELPVSIWGGANVCGQMWIECGLELLEGTGTQERDYLLPRPDKAMRGWTEQMASYTDSAAMTSELVTDLRIPRYDETEEVWKQGTQKLVDKKLAQFWSEHSPRNFLPSILIQVGVSKDKRDLLGRWAPSGADDYVRTYRTAVLEMQKLATRCILAGDPRLDESDILDRLKRYCFERLELDPLQTEPLVRRLEDDMEAFRRTLKEIYGSSCFQPSDVGGASSGVSASMELESALPEQQEVKPAKPVPKYVLVFSRNKKFVRLHKTLGSCPWPFTTLADSIELDKVEPHMYSARCKICWPALASNQQGELTDSDLENESE